MFEAILNHRNLGVNFTAKKLIDPAIDSAIDTPYNVDIFSNNKVQNIYIEQ